MSDEQPAAPTPFAAIRQEDAAGNEYWSARDLAQVLGYAGWRKFKNALDRAITACENSGQQPADHFARVGKMVALGSGAQRHVEDYHLSRFACFLTVQNADPTKPVVALGQTYFAVRTHEAETADAQAGLTAAQRRLFLRGEVRYQNKELVATARGAGVITTQDFAIFQDHGYMGLYNGERARDIARRKRLQERLRAGQPILDHMGSEELASHLFRAAQAESRIRREGIVGREAANQAHEEMGQRVRSFIIEGGGTLPEDLPTPAESIGQLEAAERRRLARAARRTVHLAEGQQELFGGDDDTGRIPL